jgi:diaminopimelate decarboxylase
LATNKNGPSLTTNRLALFPDSTRIRKDSLTIAGRTLASLADEFGTPLYIYDRATMDASVDSYKAGLGAHYTASSEITYAGKAFLCKAIAEWTCQHKLWVDCTGEVEIGIAMAGGVPRDRILVHGVNKSNADLISALRHAGTIVVDNMTELERISSLFSDPRFNDPLQPMRRLFPNIWLRLQPGLAVETHHAHTQTGQSGSKFGMTPSEIIEAAEICKSSNMPMTGLHFHQGSNFRDTSPLVSAIELGIDLVKENGFNEPWHFCPGGGWGTSYHEDELPQPDIEEYVRVITEKVNEKCKSTGLSLPYLHLEPGRSLVARAGVAIYRVGTVKRRGDRTWVLTDGGLADNLRYAMYGTKYTCLTATHLSREMNERISIAGPYCESGDVIIEDLPMPKVEEGELIAIPVSGAYHLSMSSNYNGARRPSVVWLEEGSARLIVRRETPEDLYQRDLSII